MLGPFFVGGRDTEGAFCSPHCAVKTLGFWSRASLCGSEKSRAQINTIGQEEQHTEQGNEQAKTAKYCNYLKRINFGVDLECVRKCVNECGHFSPPTLASIIPS